MDKENERIGLQEIIDKAIEELAREAGDSFKLDQLNLAEFSRRTGAVALESAIAEGEGLRRDAARKMRDKGQVNGHQWLRGVVNTLLMEGVTNSEVVFERIASQGYKGGKTTVKNYISAHANLVPAKRKLAKADPQGSRGRRFETKPGESYQMDWGFVRVEGWDGGDFKIACFAMVCHHCGTCYVEFFPNARQENLFIGMVHAFMVMASEYVLTDNMRSVTTGRDIEGKPIWQVDYAAFWRASGSRRDSASRTIRSRRARSRGWSPMSSATSRPGASSATPPT